MVKILLADDHPLIRTGLRALLDPSDQYSVVAEAADGDTAFSLTQQLSPDLLLLDVQMPGLPTPDLLARLAHSRPALKVLILSATYDPNLIRRCHTLNVAGYILKNEEPELLIQAIRVVSQGFTWISQSVAQSLTSSRRDNSADQLAQLTLPELGILRGISRGHTVPAIAQELSLSQQTVRNYTSVIYAKLGVNSRISAALIGIKHELHLSNPDPVSQPGQAP